MCLPPRTIANRVTQSTHLSTMVRHRHSHVSGSHTLRTLLLVGTGGFIGSVLRYLLSSYVQQLSKGFQFPFGTLAVNVVGCVLVGFLAELADQRSLISDETRGFLIVGILGGFTTFSAFGNETMNLLRSGEPWLAFGNILGHITLGLLSVWLGYSIASLLWK